MIFYRFFRERFQECRLVTHAANQDILLVNALMVMVMVVVGAVDRVVVEEVYFVLST